MSNTEKDVSGVSCEHVFILFSQLKFTIRFCVMVQEFKRKQEVWIFLLRLSVFLGRMAKFRFLISNSLSDFVRLLSEQLGITLSWSCETLIILESCILGINFWSCFYDLLNHFYDSLSHLKLKYDGTRKIKGW